MLDLLGERRPERVGPRERAEQPLEVREREAIADDDELVAPPTAEVARIEHRAELVGQRAPWRPRRRVGTRAGAGAPPTSRPPAGPGAPGSRDRPPPTVRRAQPSERQIGDAPGDQRPPGRTKHRSRRSPNPRASPRPRGAPSTRRPLVRSDRCRSGRAASSSSARAERLAGSASPRRPRARSGSRASGPGRSRSTPADPEPRPEHRSPRPRPRPRSRPGSPPASRSRFDPKEVSDPDVRRPLQRETEPDRRDPGRRLVRGLEISTGDHRQEQEEPDREQARGSWRTAAPAP